jgi:TolB-like protein/DNA-binding winged helix-turn-helix (wHTH) protein/Tfp pilus assembly protein PilF
VTNVTERPLTDIAPFEVAGNAVDPAGLRVTVSGSEIRLEAKAMQVLIYLAERAGQVVSRAELEERIWPGRIVTEDSVIKAIAKLRRVFHDDAREPRIIETLPKSGYRLIAQVGPATAGERRATVSADSDRRSALRQRGPTLKWIAGAAVMALLLLGFWSVLERNSRDHRSSPPAPERPSVAVIPFGNLGRAPDDDYFANGITADLITDLSKLKGLLVIAPQTTFAYRNSGAESALASSDLDVDYFVTGSVQRLQQVLRINVRLIEVQGGQALWGERYVGKLGDIFAIQDRITTAVAAALEIELAPDERTRLAARSTVSIAAYDAYLRGLEAHGGRSEAQNQAARGHFEDAVALDPQFAPAYAGLALTYSREAIDGWTSDPTQSLAQATRYADKGASQDAQLPQVHFVTGQIRLFQRRHAAAATAAERAIAVNPNYADAFALLAWTLNYSGRPEKATLALNMAMRLNPRPPASYLEILGEIYFVQGRYEDSAVTFQGVLDTNPVYLRARLWNAVALVRAGSRDLAEWEIEEALVASPQLALTRLASAFPFKDPRLQEIVLSALRHAGLP